ncbi:MAG: hypothetical protein DME05_10630 [Candidatus Rokuibacteriota bacterium]|nr:MAG: hypothetical protein DME05_10630 [Candidatus Rokubacteria bacterium]
MKFTLMSRQMPISGPTAARMAEICATAWFTMSRVATWSCGPSRPCEIARAGSPGQMMLVLNAV